MTATHGPVHPVLRTGRGPHPWVRRRRLFATAGIAGVADAPLLAVSPVSGRPAFHPHDAGCSEPQIPAAGAPGLELSFAALMGRAHPRVVTGCDDGFLVDERAS